MEYEKNCAVRIALREGPLRSMYKMAPSVVHYLSECPNTIIVDDRAFSFDHVFGSNVSQQTIFDVLLQPLVSKVLQGFNCTALAYGQTGTGKSYTMGLNARDLDGRNDGMIPRCLRQILESNNNKRIENDENVSDAAEVSQIFVSFIEIYNEKVYDLLADNSAEPIPARGYKFTGGTRLALTTLEDFQTLLQQGTKNRHLRHTPMNSESSRSHAVFTIHLCNANNVSRLNIVDLAGSEGVRRTGHEGLARSEGICINQGLLSINKVLQAMALGHKVVPYRDSVLTSVLQESLNPNSFLTFLACISPHPDDFGDTLSTIRFSQNVKKIKHTPQINTVLTEIKRKKTPISSKASSNKSSFSLSDFKRPLPCSTVFKRKPSKNFCNARNNTYSTPFKLNNEKKQRCNQSDIGLTPKEKQKALGGQQVRPSMDLMNVDYCSSVRSSLLDCTELRGSLMSLNASTSTQIGVPSTTTTTTTTTKTRKSETINVNQFNSMMSQMLDVLNYFSAQMGQSQFTLDHFVAKENQQPEPEAECASVNVSPVNANVCRNLFSSSPVFKVPEIPGKQEPRTNKEETNANDCVELLENSLSLTNSSTSSTNNNNNIRRSVRLSSKRKAMPVPLVVSSSSSSRISRSQRLNKTKKAASSKLDTLNVSTIAGYLKEDDSSIKKKQSLSRDTRIRKHRKDILTLFNSGTIQQLQLLPLIGKKTAYKIVVQRSLHGTFRNLTQIEKSSIWRCGEWQRFAVANGLT